MKHVELREYIEGLRNELLNAVQSGSNADMRFFLDKIELEIEVTIEKAGSGSGEIGFRFFVFDAKVGAEGKRASTSQQTLRLTLVPGYKGQKSGIYMSATGTKLVD